jgi:hypothetical protein
LRRLPSRRPSDARRRPRTRPDARARLTVSGCFAAAAKCSRLAETREKLALCGWRAPLKRVIMLRCSKLTHIELKHILMFFIRYLNIR